MTNLDGIKVNQAAMQKALGDMDLAVGDITNRVDTLEGNLKDLRNRWSGEARNAYDVAKIKWDASINEMRDLLRETREAVHTSNEEYMAADRRGAAQFGGE